MYKSTLENQILLVDKQELKDDVYCGNVISVVKNKKIIVSMLNTSEVPKIIDKNDLNKIKYDFESDYKIFTVNSYGTINERINKIKSLIRHEHMNEEEKQSIFKLCEDFPEIFHLDGDRLTTTTAAKHIIKIPADQPPIYRRPYRLPFAQQDEIHRQIEQMEENDIIEPSMSPWNAPLLIVKKKMDASGIEKFRVVVDFRELNKVTLNEFHPLPNITEILDQLGKSHLFSVIDLASGFYQIPLDESSRELTAFSTNKGHWHFKRMAMGMRTSPATFQRLMNSVLSGLIGIKCFVYLDDVIIYSDSLEIHDMKIRNVFNRLKEHNLKIQPDKCEFLMRECIYLGHIIYMWVIKYC